jgi:hypothetical protein
MDKDELVRVHYDWQVNNAQHDSWARKLDKKLSKIGLGQIWQNPIENQRGRECKEIKQTCHDIEWQIVFAYL